MTTLATSPASTITLCSATNDPIANDPIANDPIADDPIADDPVAEQLDLHPGLPAGHIDRRLRSAAQGRDLTNRILAFYLDELHESRKFQDLGYTCLAQYADQRLAIDPRRARELCQAGRALLTLTRIDAACRDGRLSWTKAELLTHGVGEHEQQEWIERALRVGCSELRRMLQRHRQGLSVEKSCDGGLPRADVVVSGAISSARSPRRGSPSSNGSGRR